MWGTLVGLAGQLASGIASAENNKRMRREQDEKNAANIAYNKAQANEDVLANSQNANLLREYDRAAERTMDKARNSAIVTGATPESVVATQQVVADGRAKLMGDIAATQSTRADKYNDLAAKATEQMHDDRFNAMVERNQTYANLAANAATAAGSLISGKSLKPDKEKKATNSDKLATGGAATDGGAVNDETVTHSVYNRKGAW